MIFLLSKCFTVIILLLVSEGASKNSQPLTEKEESCFRSDLQLRAGDLDGYVTWLNVFDRGDCWRYCQITLTCQALTFDTMKLTCYLFHDSVTPIKGNLDSNGNVTLVKSCTEIKRGMDIETAIKMSENAGGVLIMKADGVENSCMIKKKRHSDGEEDEEKTYSIKFGRCIGGDEGWVIRRVIGEISFSKQLLTFSPADAAHLCLDVKFNEYEDPIAVLRNCREFSPGNFSDRQIMIVSDFKNADHEGNYYYILSSWSNTSLLGTDEDYEYLDGLLFQDPDKFTKIGFCRKSKFNIPNGMLENPDNLPFFINGYSVRITCKEGFGVKKLNYNKTQTVVCSEDDQPYPCTKLKSIVPGKKNGKGIIKKRGALAMICLVAASLLISLPIITCTIYKTKRSSSSGSPEIVGGRDAAQTRSTRVEEVAEVGQVERQSGIVIQVQ